MPSTSTTLVFVNWSAGLVASQPEDKGVFASIKSYADSLLSGVGASAGVFSFVFLMVVILSFGVLTVYVMAASRGGGKPASKLRSAGLKPSDGSFGKIIGESLFERLRNKAMLLRASGRGAVVPKYRITPGSRLGSIQVKPEEKKQEAPRNASLWEKPANGEAPKPRYSTIQGGTLGGAQAAPPEDYAAEKKPENGMVQKTSLGVMASKPSMMPSQTLNGKTSPESRLGSAWAQRQENRPVVEKSSRGLVAKPRSRSKIVESLGGETEEQSRSIFIVIGPEVSDSEMNRKIILRNLTISLHKFD